MGLSRKNLRFKCIGCGDCCRRPGEVRFDHETFQAIADFLGLELNTFRKQYSVSFDPDPNEIETWTLGMGEFEPCPFLIDNRCYIHPVRPRQCRTYPFWPEILSSKKTWQAEMADCPGIGVGQPFDPIDINALAEAERKQIPVSQLLKLQHVSDD